MTATTEGSAWAPLRNTVYRNLFLAQMISNIGLWMESVGAQWFLVERGSSPTVIALVQTASLAPTILFSLLAGVLADLLDRRRMLIALSVYSGVVGAVMAVLAWTGLLTASLLLVTTFLLGAGSALTSPAWQAIQPELVPREQIPSASALGSVTVNGARAVGPALAGVVVAAAGPGAVFAFNAVSYLAVVWALAIWRRPPDTRVIERERIGTSLVVGVRYVLAAPTIRRLMLRAAMFAFPASALWALLPVASSRHLGLGSAGYGGILGVLGLGALLGVVLVPRLRRSVSASIVLGGGAAVFGVGTLALGFAPLWLAIPALLAAGAAWIAALTTVNSGIQLSLPAWVRARAMGAYLLVFMGSQAVGSYVWGAVATAVGYRTALLVAGAVLGVVALSVRHIPLRESTGKLDREVAMTWPVPTLVFEPQPDDGPVLVTVRYRVRPDSLDDFTRAMSRVARGRRRTGGSCWRLYRSGDDTELVVEQFIIGSWSEYRRQHTERWTGYDHESITAAVALTVDGRTEENRFFALRPAPRATEER
ncbi:MFS transporter [Williamsia phyllosphaerae]|uniref:MFS transporter n=1 Tax=Williamsia phyllosphaerae TaxID=885042 RepID=A0ABQ1UJS4_9NOCA|nr:MFS transporter [Williamsia phyllosphaerae]GGF19597.1 MFS transporter [Williamsia phyllosphaerae]